MSDGPREAQPIQDRRDPPRGIIPKNTNLLVLGGLAVLMVGVIALPTGKPSKDPKQATVAPASVVDPNATRIEEYSRRLDEHSKKVQQEQAELLRRRQAVGLMDPTLPPQAGPGQSSDGSPRFVPSGMGSPYDHSSPERGDGGLAAEKRRREYDSLFSSNIAFSLRSDKTNHENASEPKATMVTSAPPQAPSQQGKEPSIAPELQRSKGKSYRIPEGTFLETVLTNRLDGTFSGPINCMVNTDVYSHDGQRLLIPRGARVLGQVQPVDQIGQRRLAVFFSKLIMPDGYTVSLEKLQGLDQTGETGLRDRVDHHYMQIFGASIAIGVLAGFSQANTRSGFDASGEDVYRQGVASSLSQSSLRILDRFLNILPTFTIEEGFRIKVYLSDDLWLPAYEKHEMPSDL